ncbi:MAG: alkaline phosphatase [Bacteroidales bacterium]|nr:alkaline phosphatase [Bacteroidales bacterium]
MKRISLITAIVLTISFMGLACKSDSGTQAAGQADQKSDQPKNIILMIGDGMGVSQIYAGMTVSEQPLVFEQFKNIGFTKTFSANDYITDSGASGTALATGRKTNNGHISMSPTGDTLTTILELAEENGLSTGLISTSSILHATPASFIAHSKDRHDYAGLARDFMKTEVDVFIGGGYGQFGNRKDNLNLVSQLKEKDYQVLRDMTAIQSVSEGKLAGFTAEGHNPKYSEGRGDMLPNATQTALNILDNNSEGFFLMVEASQIDWGGHDNDTEYLVNELLDFNRAVEKALDFARKHPNTLVIVTADHETGGMGLNGGDMKKHQVKASYTSKGHTGVMVPVFAIGPGSGQFRGIYDNTDVFKKMKALYGF